MADDFVRIELPEPEGDAYDVALVTAALGELIPHERILTRGAEFAEYGKDTSMDSAVPEIVVLAGCANDVRHALYVADFYRVPVYPRGMGSGLSGGSVPLRGGIVLDVSAMDRLVSVNRGNRSCVVEPGLTVQRLNVELAHSGLWFPPWPSSHDISCIGGNIAENAGGITTVKYGVTSQWLLGLELALPGGDVVRTGSSAVKDVAGFDLTRLVCGSEGMLGVVLSAELRLLPLSTATGTAVFVFDTDEAAVAAAEDVLLGPLTPRTLEYMDARLIDCVVRQLGDEALAVLGGEAQRAGAVLAVEVDALTEAEAEAQLELLLAEISNQGGRLAGSTTDRAAALKLWRVRSELSPACHQLGAFKLSDDVCVPRDKMSRFVAGAREICDGRGLALLNYGHIGDGNFHVTLMFVDEHDLRIPDGKAAIEDICRLALELGGTITGEHGIGSAKAGLLKLQRSERELDLMRGIKAVFDPRGIMNPGKWL